MGVVGRGAVWSASSVDHDDSGKDRLRWSDRVGWPEGVKRLGRGS